MKEGCEKKIGPILGIYSFLIGQMTDSRVYVEGMVDIMVGIMIDRLKEIEYVTKSIIDYFLFIHRDIITDIKRKYNPL